LESIKRSALLPYTPEEMYRLVSDIESYPDFLPWCTDARVLSQDIDEVCARIEFSVGGLTRSFTTRNRHQVNKIIEMRLVDGPFSRLEGCWQFDRLGEEGSKISLFLEYDFENRMIGLVIGPVFSQITNTLVDSFQKRAVEVYGER